MDETKKQLWEDCIHGFQTTTEIVEDRRNKYRIHACSSKDIIELGAYEVTEVVESGELKKAAILHKTMDVDAISERQKARIESYVNRALAGCRHCKFYEPKNGKQ